MSKYFRAVEIDNHGNTTEDVSYVGVHPIAWHRHPDEPQIAFVETDVVDDLLAACEDAAWLLRTDSHALKVVLAAIAKAKGEVPRE